METFKFLSRRKVIISFTKKPSSNKKKFHSISSISLSKEIGWIPASADKESPKSTAKASAISGFNAPANLLTPTSNTIPAESRVITPNPVQFRPSSRAASVLTLQTSQLRRNPSNKAAHPLDLEPAAD
ncbi:hypothetical protein ACOSQ3_026098 [Xanthoceras sorbifolium]